jgi:glycosyltransferase involved in cell wall biosynthesis
MRLLFITHFFPPTYNAGTENYTLGLAQAFQAKGHQVQVICAEDWESGERYWNGVTEDVYDGVKVQRIHLNWLKADNPNRMLYDSLPVEKWFDQFLTTNQPDLVHVTSTHSLGVGMLRSVSRAGLPLILTLMDFWFICPNHQLLHSSGQVCDGQTTPQECQACLLAGSHFFKRFNRIAPEGSVRSHLWETAGRIPLINKQRGLRGMLLDMVERKRLLPAALTQPDLVLTHSKFVQQMFARHSSVPVEVLRNGHEFSWLNNYQGKTAADQLRLGYLGQIQWNKGVHVLVEAFKKAQLAGQARLDIWGDLARNKVYAEQLRNLIGDNPAITLRGRFEHQQLSQVLAEIDVVIVPSIWYENAPLVIQEAFAAKTPVVTTKLGGMAEAVIPEVNGLLFERGNATDLAGQLRRLVSEAGLLERLIGGLPPVKRVEEEVSELELIYQRLLIQKNKQAIRV